MADTAHEFVGAFYSSAQSCDEIVAEIKDTRNGMALIGTDGEEIIELMCYNSPAQGLFTSM